MYMDDIKLFAKYEKELETLIHAVIIYSQDIGMEFGIEKCAILIMKSGKRHMTDGMELTNQDKRSEKRKHTNILVSWRLTPSNKWKWKTRFKKNISELENYSRQNSPAETLSKEWILELCPSLDIPDPFSSGQEMDINKWIREQEN